MDLTRKNFHVVLYYDFRRGLTQKQCIDELISTFGDEPPSKTTVYHWFRKKFVPELQCVMYSDAAALSAPGLWSAAHRLQRWVRARDRARGERPLRLFGGRRDDPAPVTCPRSGTAARGSIPDSARHLASLYAHVSPMIFLFDMKSPVPIAPRTTPLHRTA
ncbi:hypothetical protein EVAR_34_1 [Eumeta japonica]|uniref:Mos1 transposase HTH domain-containing protein n=1 Tax=Eumeta variegata TaxID=151549 RepID=A0A4C1SBA6_EUMVA|nr:hypothetical protein EVAR_34_1 [Eumeta japonica]